MFTGIIQAVGQIEMIEPLGNDVKLRIATSDLPLDDVQLGDSIAVNGVCLTVIALTKDSFSAHVSKETLSCTVGLDTKKPVNLEKALRLSDRLGGHLVSGHVDGIGQVVKYDQLGDCTHLALRVPHVISRYVAIKGSLAIDGVSLTVNSIEQDICTINLIPHTLQMTTLQHLGIGSRVNLEVDLIARYVERMNAWDNEGESA